MTAATAMVFERAIEPTSAPLVADGVAQRGMRTIPGLELEIVSTRAGFDALEAEWNELFDRAASSIHLFQTFNWNWHWCNNYLNPGNGTQLAILVGRRDGRIAMIWPLAVQKVAGLRQLSWMGEPVSQYGDVLVEAGADRIALLEAGWAFIKRHVKPDIVNLRKVRADANIAALLPLIGASITESLVAPYLDLASAENFDEYEKRYSGKSRGNRRRLLRRLEEKHSVEFVERTSGAAASDLAITAIDLKRDWLKDRGLLSLALSDDRFRAFFADVTAGAAKPTDCRVSALSADGHPIALEIAVGCKGRKAMHVVVFDLAHEKSGAGVLLVEQSIRDSFAAGYDCYDLLAPGAPYKDAWADGSVGVNDWALATSMRGTLYAKVYLGFVRRYAKMLIARLPVALRRRLVK